MLKLELQYNLLILAGLGACLWLAGGFYAQRASWDASSAQVDDDLFEDPDWGRGPARSLTRVHTRFGRRSSTNSSPPIGWGALRDRLESCGQHPDDVLEVSIHSGDGLVPWRVDLRQATPGAEACLRMVLSTVPLAPDFPLAHQTIRTRLRTQELGSVTTVPTQAVKRLCTGHYVSKTSESGPIPMAHGEHVDTAPLEAVVCPAADPLVRMVITYEHDELVEVTTDPSTPCLHQAVRQHLGSPPTLWRSLYKHPLDRLVCEFDVPTVSL